MSQFSNPARGANTAAVGYLEALLDLLGDREPLGVMAEQASALAALVDGMGDSALRQPEAPGKWSMIEVLAHLADTEVVYSWRYRLTLAQERPTITGFDQDAWAQTFRYRRQAVAATLACLRVVRDANVALLEALTEEQWSREGIHEERGPESVRRMAELGAAHDLVHRAQLERIRLCVTG